MCHSQRPVAARNCGCYGKSPTRTTPKLCHRERSECIHNMFVSTSPLYAAVNTKTFDATYYRAVVDLSTVLCSSFEQKYTWSMCMVRRQLDRKPSSTREHHFTLIVLHVRKMHCCRRYGRSKEHALADGPKPKTSAANRHNSGRRRFIAYERTMFVWACITLLLAHAYARQPIYLLPCEIANKQNQHQNVCIF